MAETERMISVRAPDGAIGRVPESAYQRALDAGYTNVTEDEARDAQTSRVNAVGQQQAVTEGLLMAPDDYSVGRAAVEKGVSAATFGLAPGLDTPGARARGIRFQEEHPYQAFGAEVAGQLPLALAGGIAGEALIGGAAAAGLGRAALTGVRAADFAAQAAIGGAQTEAEQTRLAADGFSWTDAAVAGVAGEAIGRGAALGFSSALGTSRNLLARATRTTVADDAAASLSRGGVMNDFRVAHHAETYQNELATLAADDLDRLETSFAEVSRQDRKRARIVRVVEDHPEAQAGVRAEAQAGLVDLRSALAAELGETPGGPARALLRQLDERIEALGEAPTGKRLWRVLDENRQALQEYAQDLHQAYDGAPGSAWLSRDGLAALDAAEKGTRESLLREDVWGRAATEAQAAYNVPFHEKYFPSVKTVRGKLMQTTGTDARGFPVWRGDPGRVKAFFRRELNDVDSARLAEQFREYLDGVAAVAKAGEVDAPRAARDTLESVRRLRKAMANAEFIQQAVSRTESRGRLAELGFELAGAGAGVAAAGPVGGAVAFGALRGARAGDWLFRAGRRLGWGAGEAESMAKLLQRDALPAVAGKDAEPVLDDLLGGRGPSEPPPSGGAPPPSGVRPSGPAPGGGKGTAVAGAPRGPTPSMRADALRGSWAPSEAPSVSARPTGLDVAAPEPPATPLAGAARPARAERAARDTVPVDGREVGRGQMEALETDQLRDAGLAGRREAARLQALTETEFRDVVAELRATGDAPTRELADKLESSHDALTEAGFVTPDGWGSADAGRNAPTEVADFKGALHSVTAANPPGALLLVVDVRAKAGLSKEAFDRIALELSQRGDIVLHHHDHAMTLSAADRATLVHDGAQYYVGMALRSTAEAAPARAPDVLAVPTTGATTADTALAVLRANPDGVSMGQLRAAMGMDHREAERLFMQLRESRQIDVRNGLAFAHVDAPPSVTTNAAATTRVLRDMGVEMRMGAHRLAETLDTVFGAGKAPTPEQWKKIIPLYTLSQIGDVHKARIDVLGDSFIWSAEGVAGVAKPFREYDGTMNAGGFTEEAWHISRTFSRDDSGRLEVHHDHFFVRGDLQGTGAGATVLKDMLTVYRELGVDVVTVDSVEVGKYFWPSIGFDCSKPNLNNAIRQYKSWLENARELPADEVQRALAAADKIRSLPSLAQAEFGKEFLLAQPGPWNYGLRLELNDASPAYHLMRGRLDIAAAGLAVLGAGQLEPPGTSEEGDPAAAGTTPSAGFGATALLLRQGRTRLVAGVARRLFAVGAEATLRTTARLAYSRAELTARREEMQAWQANPNALVQRVAEGLRDAPPDAFAKSAAGVFTAANFLRGKLPQTGPASPVGLRGVPVSAEAAAKYARYEQSALRPGEALREAAESGYFSPELLETLQELYPDLLAEVRVAAIETVRSAAPGALSIQAKAQYARLFDGDGALADPAFSRDAVAMANLAYEQAAPQPKPPTTGGTPGVSRQAQAVAAPSPWRTA